MKRLLIGMFVIAILPLLLSAQIIVDVPSDKPPQEGNLNDAINAAINSGTLSNTIFRLEKFGYYIITGTIATPAGSMLTIEAPDPGPDQNSVHPQIFWTATGNPNTRYYFSIGGSIKMKNVWLVYATLLGDQVGSSLSIVDDPLTVDGQYGIFEGCIFEYSPCPQNAGGSISVECKKFKGFFKNCYWKNNTDGHFRYYGRAVSFPYQTTGLHSDSIVFENCTFANIGYVYMQEGGEYSDYVKFNHCTFLNVVMFPIQSGWWWNLSVTNCLFINTWMYCHKPAETKDGDPNGGTLRIDSVRTFNFEVPFTDQDRRILFTNSLYFIEKWLIDWMRNCPFSKKAFFERRDDEVPVPHPMLSPNTLRFFDSVDVNGKKVFPLINRKNLYDGLSIKKNSTVNWGEGYAYPTIRAREEYNPRFYLMPTNVDTLKTFLNKKWDDNTRVGNWAWKFMENSMTALWPLEENLAYQNDTLKGASLHGFPLGDLYHWWNPAIRPLATDYYSQWKAIKKNEDKRLELWLATGVDPGPQNIIELSNGNIPNEFSLSQNYPNPFNPTTQIEYTVPITGFVTIKAYNSLGQEVATLFSGIQKAGKHIATFDGSSLSSGVYFYTLQSGNVTLTKKLVLMK